MSEYVKKLLHVEMYSSEYMLPEARGVIIHTCLVSQIVRPYDFPQRQVDEQFVSCCFMMIIKIVTRR